MKGLDKLTLKAMEDLPAGSRKINGARKIRTRATVSSPPFRSDDSNGQTEARAQAELCSPLPERRHSSVSRRQCRARGPQRPSAAPRQVSNQHPTLPIRPFRAVGHSSPDRLILRSNRFRASRQRLNRGSTANAHAGLQQSIQQIEEHRVDHLLRYRLFTRHAKAARQFFSDLQAHRVRQLSDGI